jgi:hypothetical protein
VRMSLLTAESHTRCTRRIIRRQGRRRFVE